MCRWLAFVASEEKSAVLVADLVLRAENGLTHQSYDASYTPGFGRKNNANLNADGFGIGWYHKLTPFPAVFRSSKPLWCDINAREIAMSTKSTCIFGHVRAAAVGGVVNDQNCHPFKFGALLMQHNGHIEGFEKIKRDMINLMSEKAFNSIHGTTDTEYFFALFLSQLTNPGSSTFLATEISDALLKSVRIVSELQAKQGVFEGYTTLNVSITDGKNLVVSRFCDKAPAVCAPSLYYSIVHGPEFQKQVATSKPIHGPGDGSMVAASRTSRRDLLRRITDSSQGEDERFEVGIDEECSVIVSSEPLLANADSWQAIRENSLLIFCAKQRVFRGKPMSLAAT